MHKTTDPSQPLSSYFSDSETRELDLALEIVGRIPDDPHYYRPKGTEVAAILKAYKVDNKTLIAAILSDPRLGQLTPQPDIKALFGETIAAIVKDVNWLNNLTVYSKDMTKKPNEAETLRRMLLSMTQDVRAVLIKLAYRLHRLRNLAKETYELRHFISQETLDIYAPSANRLGVHQFKWELEDMAFRYLEPQAYRSIAKSLANNRVQRENCINSFVELLQQHLSSENINSTCYGRPKHIYSIWRKMQHKQLDFNELYDLLAVRVIVDNLTQCYTALGIVHSVWQYIPKEFDDYIANPKENGYQSLHTVILDPQGNRIEVQIRTRQMHDYAELGVAAHWAYKEGGRQSAAIEKGVASLRKLLAEKNIDDVLSEDFRSELFNDRVYVLTPAGKLIDLVKGSTPLDFAYAVHTEIGHRCRGAKVNGRIVPLTYPLKSGEQIEILTTKESAPNHNWIDPNLGYLKTSRAITKVKNWFRNQQQIENIARGKLLLEKESKRLGIKTLNWVDMLSHFKQPNTDALLEAIGRSDINNRQIAGYLKVPELENVPNARQKEPSFKSMISVAGIDNVHTTLAHCCSPVVGDDIIGYISHHSGITIHRVDCKNITQLPIEKKPQLISVSWGDKRASHAVPVIVQAFSAENLLNNVSQILAQAKIHIYNAALDTHPDFSATLNLTIQVEDTNQLSQILNKISCAPNIIEVNRKT